VLAVAIFHKGSAMPTNMDLFQAFIGILPQASLCHHTHVLDGYSHLRTIAHATKQAAEKAADDDRDCIVTSPLEHRLWFLANNRPILISEHSTVADALAARDDINVQTIVTGPARVPAV